MAENEGTESMNKLAETPITLYKKYKVIWKG